MWKSNRRALFRPHEGPQADMLMGVNGVTYGQSIPSSAHRDSVPNLFAAVAPAVAKKGEVLAKNVKGMRISPGVLMNRRAREDRPQKT